MTRCPTCYRRPDEAHRSLGRCPDVPERPAKDRRRAPQRRSQAGYVPPSRANRVPRDEYLAVVRTTDEHKRALHAERQRAYRQRRAA